MPRISYRQRSILKVVVEQIQSWKSAMNINSPIYHTYNKESVDALKISTEDKTDLLNFLDNLLNFVKDQENES